MHPGFWIIEIDPGLIGQRFGGLLLSRIIIRANGGFLQKSPKQFTKTVDMNHALVYNHRRKEGST